MLEPGMESRWVDVVDHTQLTDLPESLEQRAIDEADLEGEKDECAPNGVVELLRTSVRTVDRSRRKPCYIPIEIRRAKAVYKSPVIIKCLCHVLSLASHQPQNGEPAFYAGCDSTK